jgi:hypothetical protein
VIKKIFLELFGFIIKKLQRKEEKENNIKLNEDNKKRNMHLIVKGFITSKKAELYSDCADRYSVSTQNLKFAISDGVSRSFFPKLWADILVKKFTSQNEITNIHSSQLLNECRNEWKEKIHKIVTSENTKYYTLNAYNRNEPALATFVGLEFVKKTKTWNAHAIGDSFLFFIPKNEHENIIHCSTKGDKIENIIFDNYPDYFNSIGDNKGKLKTLKNQQIKEGTFYLMTDALAEWFIKYRDEATDALKHIKTQEEFEEIIDKERESNRLSNDDCAILIIQLHMNDGSEVKIDKQITSIDNLIEEERKKIEKTKDSNAKGKEKDVKKSNKGSKQEKQELREEKPNDKNDSEDNDNIVKNEKGKIESKDQEKKSKKEKPDDKNSSENNDKDEVVKEKKSVQDSIIDKF